jgi:hypothetical protein
MISATHIQIVVAEIDLNLIGLERDLKVPNYFNIPMYTLLLITEEKE